MSFTRRTTIASLASAAALALTAAAPQSALAQDGANYILATASTGGTYYPVGVAIATLTKVKLEPGQKIGMAAISSAGSGENVRLLREDEAQFAILQGLFGSYAWTGTGPIDEKQENLRSITMLWPNVEHFVVAADKRNTGTLADFVALSGERVGLGAQNSGTIGSNRTILAALGVDIETDYDLFFGGYGPSAEALQNGQAVGISTPAGPPVGAVTQLMASAGDGVAPLDVSDAELATIADATGGLWTRFVIPAGTYPGQDADWNTIAQPNFLAVNASVPDEHVYLITKTMFENLPFLSAIHPATRGMSLETALAGLPAPLHPGALRYFQEIGLEIPARLIAE